MDTERLSSSMRYRYEEKTKQLLSIRYRVRRNSSLVVKKKKGQKKMEKKRRGTNYGYRTREL